MTKTADAHSDPLVMKVREILRSTEPRPDPLPAQASAFGFPRVECPTCHSFERKEGYNMHWTYYHGTRFWKELEIIKLLRKEVT